MRTLFLALAAALSLTGTNLAPQAAFAADLPVKAPPNLMTGYPYAGNGFYAGIGVVGAVMSANVGDASSGTGLYSAGAALDLSAGYQFTMGGNWYALEGSAQYTNMGGSVACGTLTNCSVTSRWGFEQRALIGFPIMTVLSVMPNLGNFFPGLPALPGGVNAATGNTHPYLFAGLREDDISASIGLANAHAWKIQPIVGIGLRQQWTQGLVVDTSANCTFANTGISIGGVNNASANFGRDCRVAMRFLY